MSLIFFFSFITEMHENYFFGQMLLKKGGDSIKGILKVLISIKAVMAVIYN